MKQTGFSWWVRLALASTFLVVLALGVVTYRNTTILLATDRLVADTYHVREMVESILTAFQSTERGQQNYVLTKDERYLESYDQGVEQVKSRLAELREYTSSDDVLDKQLDKLEELATERLGQMQESVKWAQLASADPKLSEVHEHVLSNDIRKLMNSIRNLYAEMQEHQNELLESRKLEATRSGAVAHRSIIIGHLLALGMLMWAVVAMRSDRRRRNEAESQREMSEERLSAIVNSAMDAIITIDDQQRIVLVNPAAEKVFDCDKSTILGELVERFVPERLRPAVRRHILQFIHSPATHRRVGEQGPIIGLRSGGQEFPIEASVSKTLVNEQQLLTIMMRDVSEREASKRQIREQSAMLDQVRDAIHVLDTYDRIVFWNRGAERLYGWPATEVLGRKSSELMSPPDAEAAEAAQKHTYEKGGWVGELAQRSKTGRDILVEQRRTLIRDEAGRPSAQLIIDIDITDRKKADAQQRRSQRLESIGTLAGGISHDLNNVLTPILMGAKLLSREQPESRRQEIARTIQSAAERGADMIRQLLAFAGGGEARRESVKLGEVIREVQAILEHTLPKSIDVRVEIPADLAPISGDATELSQLLLNLCINARDAMTEGGQLTISAENVDVDQRQVSFNPDLTAGPHVLLTVSDTGTGITSDIIDKVFDPFFTTKEQGRGTGLGLATCLGIVRGHGGAINVYSEPGQGAEFTAYFPAGDAGLPAATDGAPRALPRGNGELILVVDDESMVLQVAAAALESHGYRALTAVGGAEAVVIYPKHAKEIKAAIIDMMMPGMDGAATIRALQEINPNVRIVASSGLRRRGKDRELPEGTQAFLPKPYSESQLLVALRQVLETTDESLAVAAAADS